MRKFVRPLVFGAVAVAVLQLAPVPLGHAQARTAPESFADLAAQLLPSVVNISTTQVAKAKPGRSQGQGQGQDTPQVPPGSPFEEFFKDFFDRNPQENRPKRNTSLGSGFIIDAGGLVVTNNHVIAEADEITVTLHDDTSLKAEIVGRDAKTDLAVLKVKTDKKLPAVKFGNSDITRVGDWVLAIGNPFGLGGTVTAGIVSARARDINSGPYDDFLQTDASINRGNSGGPMFNLAGEVIGINTAIFSPTGGSVGIGFAIPAALAKPVVDQLRQFGKTRRGWLGVRIQQVSDEIAESLGLDKARGAMVASVSANGPAEKAKIEAGDVVLTFDGKDVTDMRSLPRIVAATPIDKKVVASIWRKGKEVKLDVVVGELDETDTAALQPDTPKGKESGKATVDALGLGLAKISPDLRDKYDIDASIEGVVVTDVATDSPAAQKGVRAGDVIVEVAQDPVKEPKDVADRIKKAKAAGRKSVLILVDRQGDLRFVAIKIDG
ncbi:MAG: DegQ family serine endoprotease [Alphaproteobacteria bacterium]|nr:DegQ family serine endoprotease [Alphaproteobacteria bacterium]